jgi:general secretion pathway protein C
MRQISSRQAWRAGILVFLVAAAFLVSHTLNAFVAEALYLPPDRAAEAPAGEAARPLPYSPSQLAEDIRTSGLFLLPPAPLGITGSGGTPGGGARASLGVAGKLRLIGVVLGDQRGVFAIVEELSSKKQWLYRLHDQIPDVGEVSEIRRDGIVIRLGDQQELLELALTERAAPAVAGVPAPTASGAPLRKVIDRREVEQAMSDLPKLLTQARAVPYMVNGALSGFRIDYIAPASFYEKIGIQYGDVLQRVNGVEIRDPGTMLNLFQQLKNERTVKLDLVRNNQHSTVTYELR